MEMKDAEIISGDFDRITSVCLEDRKAGV